MYNIKFDDFKKIAEVPERFVIYYLLEDKIELQIETGNIIFRTEVFYEELKTKYNNELKIAINQFLRGEFMRENLFEAFKTTTQKIDLKEFNQFNPESFKYDKKERVVYGLKDEHKEVLLDLNKL